MISKPSVYLLNFMSLPKERSGKRSYDRDDDDHQDDQAAHSELMASLETLLVGGDVLPMLVNSFLQ